MRSRFLAGYGAPRGTPFKYYFLLVVLYNTLLAAELRRVSKPGRKTFNENSILELLLFAGATHKLSRMITRDNVTSPFRAPFTRFQHYLGYGEVLEGPRKHGPSQAIGELLSCNYCADPWVALALLYGLRYFPKATRASLGFFSAIGLADALHVAYETTRTRENVLTLREHSLEHSLDKKAA